MTNELNQRRRRIVVSSMLTAGMAGALGTALPARAQAPKHTLRIGFQKSSTLMILLKSRETLEKALAPLGASVQWYEFTSGLPLLESLNIGNLDLSADVADAVPPFALAAGANLTYYAIETPSPEAQAIVVRQDSPIKEIAQLKGQRIAFAKGAGAHYLLLEALASAGLSIRDIEPAYLSPADARAAFERGSVAAWVIWDPFLAAVQRQANARILRDGKVIELPALLPRRHAVRAQACGCAGRGLRRTAPRRRMDQAKPRGRRAVACAADRPGRAHGGSRQPPPDLPGANRGCRLAR